jgi:hypothetical protein
MKAKLRRRLKGHFADCAAVFSCPGSQQANRLVAGSSKVMHSTVQAFWHAAAWSITVLSVTRPSRNKLPEPGDARSAIRQGQCGAQHCTAYGWRRHTGRMDNWIGPLWEGQYR